MYSFIVRTFDRTWHMLKLGMRNTTNYFVSECNQNNVEFFSKQILNNYWADQSKNLWGDWSFSRNLRTNYQIFIFM